MKLKQSLIGSLIALAGLAGAHAGDVGQHPAVFAPRGLPGVDPSTFIVAHPAGLAWRRGHANHAHPAVANKAAGPQVDTDHYLVQPPASTRWTVRPAAEATMAQRPLILR